MSSSSSRLPESEAESKDNLHRDAARHASTDEAPPRKPPVLKRLWGQISSHLPLAMMMFKGSLPMTITLAMTESTVIAHKFTIVGYIIAIISFFSMAMLPRAKFLESMAWYILFTLLGAAVCLLAMWTGIQARKHTTAPGSMDTYNSSQAVVCAIWFFFSMFCAGTIRARFPLLQSTMYLTAVFMMIALTYAPRFPTMKASINFIEELIEIFYIAFGVAAGVSLLIFPLTTRTILFKKQAAYLGAYRGFLKKQTEYFLALRSSSALPGSRNDNTESANPSNVKNEVEVFPEKAALKAALGGLIGLHTQIYNDNVYAKREIAWGKLNADDLQQLFKAFRAILTPMAGMRTIIEVFDRIWESAKGPASEKNQLDITYLWRKVLNEMHDPFIEVVDIMDQGLQHAGMILEYFPRSRRSNDAEERAGTPKVGDPEFADYMDNKIKSFHSRRGEFLSIWVQERNTLWGGSTIHEKTSDHQHVYIILHLEHLMYTMAIGILSLVRFADMKVHDGTLAKSRLVYPSLHRIMTLVGNTLFGKMEDVLIHEGEHVDGSERGFRTKTNIQSKAKDPQHLPPQNSWERWSNYLRIIPRFFKSKEAVFGFRMAVAAMSVGILAFLKNTYVFYYQQKLIWTVIVVIVGMELTSGVSTFRLAARVLASIAAMVISYAAWYIVDGKPGGVIVFVWISFMGLSYGFVKHPRFFIVWLCVLVTIIAIIGSSLQSKKLGHETILALGQEDYPIYLNAPYRLATVLAGCVVAYFWTLFPYPITDRGLLSEKLGDLMFLVAKYHDCGHSIASLKIRGAGGDPTTKASPENKLMKIQHRLFHEIMTRMPPLQMHSTFQKFEFPIGGRFPAARYSAITTEMTNILGYINLLTLSTDSWPSLLHSKEDSQMNTREEQDISMLFSAISTNTHHLTSVLTLLSASVKHGIPLPPYFQPPPKVDFTNLWERLVQDIAAGVNGDSEREAVYSAWAVMQIVGELVNTSLGRMVIQVRELVGEVDFGVQATE